MSQRQKLRIIKGAIAAGEAVFGPAGETIEVPFNPTEYTISAQNNFGEAAVVGLTQPVIQFGGGGSRSLQFELLADTLAYHGGQNVHARVVSQLESLLDLVPGLMSPPPCRVTWGAGLAFVGVLESLEARYEHFLEDGTPVRARVSVRFKEYLRAPATPGGQLSAVKIVALQSGQSLPDLAQQTLGDPRKWRELAQANDIERPRTVRAGQPIRMR